MKVPSVLDRRPKSTDVAEDLRPSAMATVAIQPSSVNRFSENFDQRAERCLIFFLGMH